MASIIQINGRWRALIRRKGIKPKCKTFALEKDARAWAAREERRIDVVTKGIVLEPQHAPTPYRIAGVYMLFKGSEIRYVGRSVSVYRRMNDHDRASKDWDSFRIWPCPDWAEAAELERRLIEVYQPPLNVAMAIEKPKQRAKAMARAKNQTAPADDALLEPA